MDDVNQYCPLTRFSHTLFANSALDPVLSQLQNQGEFNLNVIFYLLWTAKACHGRLTKRQLKALQQQIAVWHQRVILELKYTYAMLAHHSDPDANEIKRAIQEEILRANDIEQRLLFESRIKTHLLRRTPRQQLSDACASIANYSSVKQSHWMSEHRSIFSVLFACVFEEVVEDEIEREIASMWDRTLLVNPPVVQQVLWE